MNRTPAFVATVMAASIVGIGCNGSARVSDDAGCAIAVNQVARLGALSDPVSVVSGSSSEVERTRDGGWLVLQRSGEPVLRYHPDGRFDRVWIREGNGPNEIRRPSRMTRGPGDSLWVQGIARVIVLDPHGTPTREILPTSRRFLTSINRNGSAASFRVRDVDQAMLAVVTVRDSEGDSITSLGAGAADSLDGGTIRSFGADLAVLVEDTLAYAASSRSPTWLEILTPESSRPLMLKSDAWDAIRIPAGEAPTDSGDVMGIVQDDAGLIWGISWWSAEPEDVRATLAIPDYSQSFLWVSDPEKGSAVAAIHLPHLARGFADARHHFADSQQPSGLIAIDVYRHEISCPRSDQATSARGANPDPGLAP